MEKRCASHETRIPDHLIASARIDPRIVFKRGSGPLFFQPMIMESWLETAPGNSESGLSVPFIHGTRTSDDVCVEVRRRLRGKALTIPLLVRRARCDN